MSVKNSIFALLNGPAGSFVDGSKWLGNESHRNCETMADSIMVSSSITPGMEYFMVGTRPVCNQGQLVTFSSVYYLKEIDGDIALMLTTYHAD